MALASWHHKTVRLSRASTAHEKPVALTDDVWRDKKSGVLVRIQGERLNGSFDLTNPKTLRWVTQLRADPAYQNAVDVIASASTQNDAWRAAARFIESDDFVRAVYVADPRARHDVPPP